MIPESFQEQNCVMHGKKKKKKVNPMNAEKIRFGKFVGVSTSMSRKPFCGNTVRNS